LYNDTHYDVCNVSRNKVIFQIQVQSRQYTKTDKLNQVTNNNDS